MPQPQAIGTAAIKAAKGSTTKTHMVMPAALDCRASRSGLGAGAVAVFIRLQLVYAGLDERKPQGCPRQYSPPGGTRSDSGVDSNGFGFPLAGAAVLGEMREVDGQEKRIGLDGDRAIGVVHVCRRAQEDLATGHARALGPDVQDRANRDGDAEIRLQPCRDGRGAQQPAERAERLVHRTRQQTAMRQARSALMVVA